MSCDDQVTMSLGGGHCPPCENIARNPGSSRARESNIELFRIITMLLIVAHHYVVNSGLLGTIFLNPLEPKSYFLLLFGAWGKTGINCFLLITGYFMCTSHITLRKYLKVFLEYLFYRYLIYAVFFCTGAFPFNAGNLMSALLPWNVIGSNFFGTYLVFFLFIPFLNILVLNLTEKQHLLFIGLLSFTYILFGTLPKLSVTMNYVSWYMVLYIIASYIRLYPKPAFSNARFWGAATVSLMLIASATVVYGVTHGQQIGKNEAYRYVSDCNTFLAVAIGVSSFLFFKNLKIKYSKWINTIASTTFGVLCIHAHSNAMRNWLWVDTLKNVEFYAFSWSPLHAAASVIGVFLICVVIDLIRIRFVETPFFALYDKTLNTRFRNLFSKAGPVMNFFNKLLNHRFLFEELVKRDFKQKYKRTVLGMAWSILSPLMTLLVMRVVFTQFFGRNMPHYTIYLFAGNLMFAFFKESTTGGMNALMSNAHIFTKINVPKYIFLLTKNVSSIINFGLTLLVFFFFAALDGVPFGWHFLYMLYPILCMIVFNIGIGLILSALFVFFRDISYLYDVFTLLLMYASAIFYPVDSYPPAIQNLFLCNPVYCAIKYVRLVVLEAKVPSAQFHLLLAFYAGMALLVGCLIYKKKNHEFLYYV